VCTTSVNEAPEQEKAMMGLPPPDVLSLSGMVVVGVFGLWKTQLAPRLARRRSSRGDASA